MREEDIPDLNLFMMCEVLDERALSSLPSGYTVRSCRPDELPVWKAFPFDDPQTAADYADFMEDFYRETYGGKEAEFFAGTLFVCDAAERPVATCLLWKAYGRFSTIHWFKTVKEREGQGIGRGLLSIIMRGLSKDDYPVYLHTQAGSFRAIKLYSDFGFQLLTDDPIGMRRNHVEESLPILREFMPKQHYRRLRFRNAPSDFLRSLLQYRTNEW